MDVVARLRAAGCVYAEEEAALLRGAARDEADLARLVDERAAGVSVEHLLGWAEFAGLRVAVAPGVFVPRRRTTLLVRQAVRAAKAAGPGAVVVDLCCGTGAVAAAVRAARPDAEVHAADVDPAAVACARRNLPAGSVHEGDLFAALPRGLRGRVDVLVANAPYVPTGDLALLPPEAREHEHRVALDGGDDGLDVQRRVADGLGAWLAPGGTVVVETGRHQATRSARLLRRAGLTTEVVTDDKVDGCGAGEGGRRNGPDRLTVDVSTTSRRGEEHRRRRLPPGRPRSALGACCAEGAVDREHPVARPRRDTVAA